MKLDFSLDCELVWGISFDKNPSYLKTNVSKSQKSIEMIVSGWNAQSPSLCLAFVGSTIKYVDGSQKRLEDIYGNWPEVKQFPNLFRFESRVLNYCELKPSIRYGLHGAHHDFYNQLEGEELSQEIDKVKSIAFSKNMTEMFVYPKNIAEMESYEAYSSVFKKIRVNSNSWLYRSSRDGVSKTKRILRYADSFFPIYELFCNKSPEKPYSNAKVGTHFYRANLKGVFLWIHYIRLRIGFYFMKYFNYDMHIWSHPHNFGGHVDAVRYFHLLSKLK